jgi:hypothetical protein
MAYSSGGLIQASDLNNRAGLTTANASGQINGIWTVGNGNSGYGQSSAVLPVIPGGSVLAGTLQGWATLYNALNAARKHQSGSGYTNLTVPQAGDTITYDSSLDTTLAAAYTNRLISAAVGSTTTGTNDTYSVSGGANGVAFSMFRDVNVSFITADAARYFFNAGGRLAFYFSATSNYNQARSNNARDLINAIGGITAYTGYTNSGRTGSGYTLTTNNTSYGYWNNLNGVGTNIVRVDDDVAPYASDYAELIGFTNSGDTTNGANGSSLTVRMYLNCAADAAGTLEEVNITLTSRCDITYPSTTYLTDTWGTPTISFDSA